MGKISKQYIYQNGTPADASKLEADLTAIVNALNTNYDDFVAGIAARYTKEEVNALLTGISLGSIADGSLTVAKVNALFGKDLNISENPNVTNKAAATHDHSGVYSPTGHDHNAAYSAIGHSHATAYLSSGGGTVSGSVEVTGGMTSDTVSTRALTVTNTLASMAASLNTTVGNLCYGSIYYNGTHIGNFGKTGANPDMMMSAVAGKSGLYSVDKSVVMDGTANEFRPSTNGTVNSGNASFKWSTVFAVTGTISTSDRDQKQDIGPIQDAVLDAWAEVNYSQFRFKDAVADKGDAARFHFGVIAQEIEEAFTRHGLDAFKWGLLCYDEWDDAYEDVYELVEKEYTDQDGNIVKYMGSVYKETVLVRPAGHLYSVRNDECQYLEAALMRRELNRLKGGS